MDSISLGGPSSGGSDAMADTTFGHTGTGGSTDTTGDGVVFGGPGGESSGGGRRLAERLEGQVLAYGVSLQRLSRLLVYLCTTNLCCKPRALTLQTITEEAVE